MAGSSFVVLRFGIAVEAGPGPLEVKEVAG